MAHCYLADLIDGDVAALTGEEARHAAQVARLRVGERVVVTDGRGRIAQAEAVEVARDRVALRVLELRDEPPPSPRLVLAQALAKGGRDELAIQAATELGVAAVIPWAAERSVSRWSGPKVAAGRQRWASIVREAGKQAVRAWSVDVEPLHSTADLAALAAGRLVLVLVPDAATRLLDAVPGGTAEVVLVVGPEGGTAPRELAALTAAGAVPVRLGPTVLRTSSAGPAAIAALAGRLDLWP